MSQFVTREHEIEPIPGLPGKLPEGEHILWQGRPSSKLVARHVMKTRWIAGYFIVLASWAAIAGIYDGKSAGGIVFSVAVLIALAAVALGLLELFAWAVRRTTLYTITNRRVVMRFGVAFSMTLNLPFKQIETAAMRLRDGDAGSIAIKIRNGARLSWLVQWPHVRGWKFAEPEPSLICLPDARKVAETLAVAITQYQNAQAGQGKVVRTGTTQKPAQETRPSGNTNAGGYAPVPAE